MTVGELRELISELDDDFPVLVPASDHSYRAAVARDDIAVYDERHGWSEDFGELNPDEVTEDDRHYVLVVSSE
jgi:hypothetical protein